MRKITAILAVCALVLAISPLTAFAHGHGRGHGYGYGNGYGSRSTVQPSYTLCATEHCNTTGLHAHDSVYYYGHYIGDGHDYHQLCDVQGCLLTGVHDHDGVACFGHFAGDGHSYCHTSYGYGGGWHH